MSSLTNWLSPTMFSPSTMHSLGWTLLHFLWQGMALAALAAVLMSLCHRASARYVLAVGTLVLMLAAPVATFFFLLPSGVPAPAKSSPIAETQRLAPGHPVTSDVFETASNLSRRSSSLDTLPWLVEAWLFGVAYFSLRSAGGFLLLERERRKQSTPPSARVLDMCRTLQRQLHLQRAIRYCECKRLQAPAVIGWFRPIVLLPVAALTGLSEEQLRSVIAHELAHIQRLDPFVNLFQIVVETLLFYHPAVWWLNRRIRAEREHCCDDVAVSLCGNPVEYARALTLMEEWRSAPVLAMAANRGPLYERIFRVLGCKTAANETRGLGITGSLLCLTAALVAGNSLLAIAYPKTFARAQASVEQSAEVIPVIPSTQSDPASAVKPTAVDKPSPRPEQDQKGESQPVAAGSYIDGMKAAGLDNLTVEQLVALKIQNVTPEYARRMRELGMHPDADNLVAMRIQGVTPELVHDLRELGLSPDAEQIVALKIQGVDTAYVRGLKEAGIQPDIDQLIALKIQSVTPTYVRALRELGLQPDADDLVGLKIQGVTPEYVRDIRALGLVPDADEFIAMRIQGITPEFVKGLQAAGLKFDVSDLIGAKIQGITPEFIAKARQRGFQSLTLDKLIQLKNLGILGSRGEI
jgi:beta-lactamase regulating signal transducer with metallopeptidase domain